MKLVVIPKSIEELYDLIDVADAFIVGIENLSINLPSFFSVDEIKEISNKLASLNKEIFVSLNKNMHNSDLPLLEKTLLELENISLTGILYYDIAIVNLKNKLGLKHDLVWSQEHMTTNAYTCNYWHEVGAKYVTLAAEITSEEIIEIKESSNMKLIVPVFGYLPMFASRRHLVKNYLEFFNLEDNSKINYIFKEGKTYPIIDSKTGTVVYSAYILNGIKESLELKEHNIDYLLLNSIFIDDELFKEILMMFKNVNNDNVLEYQKKIDNSLLTDRGFLYKETVYKVKNNE